MVTILCISAFAQLAQAEPLFLERVRANMVSIERDGSILYNTTQEDLESVNPLDYIDVASQYISPNYSLGTRSYAIGRLYGIEDFASDPKVTEKVATVYLDYLDDIALHQRIARNFLNLSLDDISPELRQRVREKVRRYKQIDQHTLRLLGWIGDKEDFDFFEPYLMPFKDFVETKNPNVLAQGYAWTAMLARARLGCVADERKVLAYFQSKPMRWQVRRLDDIVYLDKRLGYKYLLKLLLSKQEARFSTDHPQAENGIEHIPVSKFVLIELAAKFDDFPFTERDAGYGNYTSDDVISATRWLKRRQTMESLPDLAAFFGWCALVNIGILTITGLALILGGEQIAKIHGAMLGLDAKELRSAYFRYIANYKLLVIVLNLVPYIAIRIMQ